MRPKAAPRDETRAPSPILGGDETPFVRNEADKARGSRFPLVSAFACAGRGLGHAMRTQRNMRIHLVSAVLAVVLSFILSLDPASWAAVILCIALVLSAECMNTALESLVDLVSPGYHELARRAKDCAAGAVLVASLASLAVACVVFLPRLLTLCVG